MIDTERILKASRAVYLAAPEIVAADLSGILVSAARRIEFLEKELAECKAELVKSAELAAALETNRRKL